MKEKLKRIHFKLEVEAKCWTGKLCVQASSACDFVVLKFAYRRWIQLSSLGHSSHFAFFSPKSNRFYRDKSKDNLMSECLVTKWTWSRDFRWVDWNRHGQKRWKRLGKISTRDGDLKLSIATHRKKIMKINSSTVLVGAKVVLVPYREEHVPK